MRVGDLVISTSETGLEQVPMIYMGIGIWTGWIQVYCPKLQKRISVRRTYVQKVTI